jgi:hypothetical protein
VKLRNILLCIGSGSAEAPLASVTVPGVVTTCGPLEVEIVQDAPGTPGVSTATSWFVPFVIVAQPTRNNARRYFQNAG